MELLEFHDHETQSVTLIGRDVRSTGESCPRRVFLVVHQDVVLSCVGVIIVGHVAINAAAPDQCSYLRVSHQGRDAVRIASDRAVCEHGRTKPLLYV